MRTVVTKISGNSSGDGRDREIKEDDWKEWQSKEL